ncbi:hypothetical protein ADUPG1_014825, partial [Aduncisulcus paluster]
MSSGLTISSSDIKLKNVDLIQVQSLWMELTCATCGSLLENG